MDPVVVNVGNVLLDNKEALRHLFTVLADYQQQSKKALIIVHGGGYLVDELIEKLAQPVVRRNGLRATTDDQMEAIVGALAGTANKVLLAEAKKNQLFAVGLCLSDGDTVRITALSDKIDHIGQATVGNPNLLRLLLEAGYLPIVSAIGITEQGVLMNVNTQQAAAAIAETLGVEVVPLGSEILVAE